MLNSNRAPSNHPPSEPRVSHMSWMWTGAFLVTALLTVTTPHSYLQAQSELGSETRVTSSADGYSDHIKALRERLPEGNFKIAIEQPFVVISDESEILLKRRRKSIRWAVDRLKEEYFANDPDHIIDIWLFKDKESYETNVLKLFGSKPGTPYGYYSSRHRALVMNISTGSGTLVHEIVHPFIERNFPDCPSWFNEGLASLYEQCGEKDGKINGYTNWRLAGLQRRIAAKSVPSFQDLCATTTREFYDEDGGTNYSQARYLCYYLQEQGKLKQFYDSFVKNCAEDPTGYETLQVVLNHPDMAKFQTKWQGYIAKLKFP